MRLNQVRKIFYPVVILMVTIWLVPWEKVMTRGYLSAWNRCSGGDYACLTEFAKESANPYICSLLDPGLDDVCYFQLLTKLTYEVEDCHRFGKESYRQQCRNTKTKQ